MENMTSEEFEWSDLMVNSQDGMMEMTTILKRYMTLSTPNLRWKEVECLLSYVYRNFDYFMLRFGEDLSLLQNYKKKCEEIVNDKKYSNNYRLVVKALLLINKLKEVITKQPGENDMIIEKIRK